MKYLFAFVLSVFLLVAFTGCGITPGNRPPGNSAGGSEGTEGSGLAQPAKAERSGETNQVVWEKRIKVMLYFANKDNTAVFPEEREVEVKDGAIMKAAVEALLDGPSDVSLRKAIPDGTRLLGINRKENLAIVDFSKEYNLTNSTGDAIARVAVVNTLTGIPGIEKVKILVEGKELLGKTGKPLGELGRVMLDAQGHPVQGEVKYITVYFGNANADKVVAEKREVCLKQGETLEKLVFEELSKGPVQQGLYPVIPKGTRLLSIETKNGLCFLNLSREFVDNHPGGSAGEAITINSIVNSLTELPDINKVQFMIEGKTEEVFIHVMFDKPFSRNEDIIQK